jgi:hypothetical protein
LLRLQQEIPYADTSLADGNLPEVFREMRQIEEGQMEEAMLSVDVSMAEPTNARAASQEQVADTCWLPTVPTGRTFNL